MRKKPIVAAFLGLAVFASSTALAPFNVMAKEKLTDIEKEMEMELETLTGQVIQKYTRTGYESGYGDLSKKGAREALKRDIDQVRGVVENYKEQIAKWGEPRYPFEVITEVRKDPETGNVSGRVKVMLPKSQYERDYVDENNVE